MCDEFDVKLLELEDFWKRSFADYHAFDKGKFSVPHLSITYSIMSRSYKLRDLPLPMLFATLVCHDIPLSSDP
jgi:hypothetical protein